MAKATSGLYAVRLGYQVRRDIPSLSHGFLASIVRARSSIRGRPFFGASSEHQIVVLGVDGEFPKLVQDREAE